MAQIRGHRHRSERAHPRAARISKGNPDARKEQGGEQARDLAQDLTKVALAQGYDKHQPVCVDVLEGASLAEDVSALQVEEE